MKRLLDKGTLLASFLFVSFSMAHAQKVNVELEVNGQMKNADNINIEISDGQQPIKAKIQNGSFTLDLPEFTNDNPGPKATVRIRYSRYRIEMRRLSFDHFRGKWKVSISDRRFLNLTGVKNKSRVDYGFKVEFNSIGELGTVTSKIVYKSRK